MRESSLKAAVMNYLRRHDWVVRKRHGTVFGVSGDPDLYALGHGVHLEVELKVPGEDPTPLQQKRLEEWRQAGALEAVIHSMEELREWLEKVGRGGKLGQTASTV